MKKVISMCLLFVLLLTACGTPNPPIDGASASTTGENELTTPSEADETTAPEEVEATTPEDVETTTPEENTSNDPDSFVTDIHHPYRFLIFSSFNHMKKITGIIDEDPLKYEGLLLKNGISYMLPSEFKSIVANLEKTNIPVMEFADEDDYGIDYYFYLGGGDILHVFYKINGISYRFDYKYDETENPQYDQAPALTDVAIGDTKIDLYKVELGYGGFLLLNGVHVYVTVHTDSVSDISFDAFDFISLTDYTVSETEQPVVDLSQNVQSAEVRGVNGDAVTISVGMSKEEYYALVPQSEGFTHRNTLPGIRFEHGGNDAPFVLVECESEITNIWVYPKREVGKVEDFFALQHGMSLQEVISLLDAPSHIPEEEGAYLWYRSDSRLDFRLDFSVDPSGAGYILEAAYAYDGQYSQDTHLIQFVFPD